MQLQTTLLGRVSITSPWASVGRILQATFWGAEMLGHRGCISSTLVGLPDNDPKRLHNLYSQGFTFMKLQFSNTHASPTRCWLLQEGILQHQEFLRASKICWHLFTLGPWLTVIWVDSYSSSVVSWAEASIRSVWSITVPYCSQLPRAHSMQTQVPAKWKIAFKELPSSKCDLCWWDWLWSLDIPLRCVVES